MISNLYFVFSLIENLCVKHIYLELVLVFRKYWNMIKMTSDFAVASSYLWNVRINPIWTKSPPPTHTHFSVFADVEKRLKTYFPPHPLQIFGHSACPVVVVVVYGKLAFSSSCAVQKSPFFCLASRPTQLIIMWSDKWLDGKRFSNTKGSCKSG